MHPIARGFGIAFLCFGACSKSAPSGELGPAPSASAAVASPATVAPSGAPVASGRSSSWAGSYVAKVGAVDPPANAKEKTWTLDPGSAQVGKGTIELAVTEPRGEVAGAANGSLGPMTISGLFDGRELRANLLPKDPKDGSAMTGYLVLSGDGPQGPLKGTLRVSGRDARVVREAAVELSKK